MSRVDIIIFGATGFTGKYAVEEMVKMSHRYPELTWGLAGRSEKKLHDLLEDISLKTGEDITKTKTIIADVTDYESLKHMCSQAKVVANCSGPYFKFGEPVVKAAIASKTHYVDVACEMLFMELMQFKYNQQASEAGVYVVSGCAVYSIPNDLGVLFLEENFTGTLNSVESYLKVDILKSSGDNQNYGLMHKTSWDSMLCSLIYRKKLEQIRRTMYPEPLPLPKVIVKGRSLHVNNKRFCSKILHPEESVVYRTQRHLYATEQKRPVQFHSYYKYKSFLEAVIAVVTFFIFNILTRFSFISKCMLKYPNLFTLGKITDDGPSEYVMETRKLQFELYGKGWSGNDEGQPDKTMVAKVSMTNPYRASGAAQNIAALTILMDIDKMPGSGGVLTPGVAFRKTDLIKRLKHTDITFEIIKTSYAPNLQD